MVSMNEIRVLGSTMEFMGKHLKVIEGGFGEGKRVITDNMIAIIHSMETKNIRSRIKNNLSRFKVGIDIIDLKGAYDTSTLENLGYSKQAITQSENLYLLSERGYGKLIKIMDSDLAWDIYDNLLDEYFTMREIIQSEEEMLKKLYPSVPEDFIKLSAHNIREVASLKLENKKKDVIITKTKEEVKHKAKMIDDLTTDMDTPLICKTVTDYVNILVHKKNEPHPVIYNKIYELLGRRLSKDIKYGRSKYNEAQRKLVLDNIAKNKELGLKGENRKFPFKMADAKANLSILEYIVDILGEGHLLIETIAKMAEVGVDEVIEKYNYYKTVDMTDVM